MEGSISPSRHVFTPRHPNLHKPDKTERSKPFVLKAPEPIRQIVEYVCIKHNTSVEEMFSDATFTKRDMEYAQKRLEYATKQAQQGKYSRREVADARQPRRFRCGMPRKNHKIQVARAEVLARCHCLGFPYSVAYLSTLFEVYHKTIVYAFKTLDTWRLTYRDNGIELPVLVFRPQYDRRRSTTPPTPPTL
jgi:hypothetical protein